MTISGAAPYYRLAAEPVWGEHSLMVGAYGMAANIIPNRIFGFGTDKIFDAGFDSQYQWITDQHAVIINRNREASMLIPGDTLLVYEMTPALFAAVAANEAEKAAPGILCEHENVARMPPSLKAFMARVFISR